MPAGTPEEIPALLAAAMNAGDLDAFVELHEDDATTTVPPDGHVPCGKAQIRAALEPIIARAPQLRNEVLATLEGDQLAITHARRALTSSGPNGQAVEHQGRVTIVSRRRPGGGWRIVLENTMSPE